MAEDTKSVASEWDPSWGVEQLSIKLRSTREQLKKAISKIVTLEEKDAKTQARLDKLELSVTVILSRSETQLPAQDDDSLADQWQHASDDELSEKDPPPATTPHHQSPSKNNVSSVQVNTGGGDKGQQGPGPDLDPDIQHGIRAPVLDPSKVVHYRFDGKERDYLQW